MRKYLYILTFLLVFLIGCSKQETTYTTSSENRVNTFTFYQDTSNIGLTEATYKVEHLSDTGLIYCVDSLRFGTRLDSVVPSVTYKATPASATYFLPDTSVISTGADTLDFSRGPIYLMVQSSDLEHKRWYRINVFVHQADPNLYVWKQLTNQIFEPQNCEMKAFYIHDKVHLYINNGFSTQLYVLADGENDWQLMGEPVGLPTPCSVRDILQHNDTLYYTENDMLYTSTDMQHWTSTDFADSTYALVNMLVVFDNLPWCILQDTVSKNMFLGTVQNNTIQPESAIYGLPNGILPKDFPVSDFAALSFVSSSQRPRAMIVGGRNMDGEPVNTRWNIEYELTSGYRMVDFSIEQPSFKSLTGMSVIQYNNHLMMFGGIDNDLEYRSDILYSDNEGMSWYVPDTAQNRLPDTYQSRQKQTVVMDDDDNIYIIGGQTNTQTFSDVYRGYLNSMKW